MTRWIFGGVVGGLIFWLAWWINGSFPSTVTVYVLFGIYYFGVWRLLEEYRRRVGPLSDWWWRLARLFGFLFFMAYVLGVVG